MNHENHAHHHHERGMSASCGVETSWKSTAGSHTWLTSSRLQSHQQEAPLATPIWHGSPGLTSDHQSLVGGGAHDDTGYDLGRYDRATRLRDTQSDTRRNPTLGRLRVSW